MVALDELSLSCRANWARGLFALRGLMGLAAGTGGFILRTGSV